MIKKIIFDLDNTLIEWKSEYGRAIRDALKDSNMDSSEDLVAKLGKAIDEYEIYYDTYDKEIMRVMFEKYTNLKIPNEFMDRWLYNLESCTPNEDKELEKTLKYLSSKYELVVLTNWFSNCQSKRLENLNVSKYFKEIIGTDKIKNKPNEKSYEYACNPYKYSECVMVGDNYEIDIEVPKKLGMKTIEIGVDIKDVNELRREPWN